MLFETRENVALNTVTLMTKIYHLKNISENSHRY